MKAQAFMKKGELVPDEITIGMLNNKVEANPDVEGYIFDGFPRTILQAESLDKLLKSKELAVTALIALEVDDDEIVKRLLERGKTGEEGVEEWKILELKVLADVGLVGFPNAGKSTLLASLSAAKPKIGNYPFTTLVPNLGIVGYRDGRSFIMADIPGIIENAHEGKGLGLRFLRHIERNSVLLFVVPADSESIKEAYHILLGELEKYNPQLLDKQRILGVSKTDLIDDELKQLMEDDIPDDLPTIWFSAVTGENIQQMKDLLWKTINEE
ncbi:UNVERIFIED_CONTAM: hypothetical protein GTU68_027151 [Idotea baltica]|nr:hypothetical protein [Idotea baltica]